MQKQYNQYLETKVTTASREDLVLMLYEGMERFLNEAARCIKEKEIEGAGNAIIRVQRILMELANALDEGVNPQVANSLKELYLYMYTQLMNGQSRKEVGIVEEVKGLVQGLHSAWREAVKSFKIEKAGAEAGTAIPAASDTQVAPTPPTSPTLVAPAISPAPESVPSTPDPSQSSSLNIQA